MVALIGSTLSSPQANLLRRNFEHATLMLDGDDAGQQGAAAIGSALATTLSVKVITLDHQVQPDQLSAQQIRSILGDTDSREATS